MKVRVKYCGGCNPRYDRRAVAKSLAKTLPEAEFLETHMDGPVDFVAVLCGCPSACAAHEDLQGRCGKIVASSEEEAANLEKALEAMLKK